MFSVVHRGHGHGIKASNLSKIWCVDKDIVKHTLKVATHQQSIRKDNPKLSGNYGTNYRMLKYKHLKEFFYMDTLFVTSKSKKSSSLCN